LTSKAKSKNCKSRPVKSRPRNFTARVQDILAKMQAFGITVKDLQNAKPAKSAKGVRGKKLQSPASCPRLGSEQVLAVAAKYRGPNGETWSGRGLTPKWLAALIGQGQSKESFAVNAQ